MAEKKPRYKTTRIPLIQSDYLEAVFEPPSELMQGERADDTPRRRMSCIIMMHGFPGDGMNGQGMLFPMIAATMGKHGFASIRFDFRGCGQSSGDSQNFSLANGLSDLRKTMDWLREKHKFSQYILVAEGLSAQIALQSFMPNLVTGMVFLWPNLNPLNSHLSFLKDANDNSQVQKAGFLDQDGVKYGLNLINEVNMLNIQPLLETITCPTIVQHGRDDSSIPVDHIQLLRDYMIRSRIELGLFEKGENGLKDPGMRKAMLMNIEQFLKKIP